MPAISIDDSPRFPWRGLMIDVSRHFIPLDVLKRNLDGMAAVKLNVFHWHLSDNQGFRVESKKFPKLHELGSDGLYYTQDEVRDLIAYARERGIRVVPEFDMPGHSTAWFVGYPELASGPGPYEIERKWGVFDPAMDPTREETYKFLDEFIGEMARLFPDQFFHIGGDEVNGKQWDANPKIQAVHARTRPEGQQRSAGVFQQARAADREQARKNHGGLGRNSPSRPAEEHCHSVLARTGFAGAGGQAGLSRTAVVRLLCRSDVVGRTALCDRSAERRRGRPDSRGAKTHSGWRGLHVGGVCFAGKHRFAHLAAHGCDRRAIVVSARCARREFDVPANGR